LNRFGIFQKMATKPFSPSMSDTTVATNTRMGESERNSSVQGSQSSSEREPEMLDLFGENSSMTAGKMALTAHSSEMKAKSNRVSLSDRQTISLIKSGLVKGITPTSVRKQFGAPIPDTVTNWRVGGNVE